MTNNGITPKGQGRTPIACNNCAKTKTKCDRKFPCTRCASKNIDCTLRATRRQTKNSARATAEKGAMEKTATASTTEGSRDETQGSKEWTDGSVTEEEQTRRTTPPPTSQQQTPSQNQPVSPPLALMTPLMTPPSYSEESHSRTPSITQPQQLQSLELVEAPFNAPNSTTTPLSHSEPHSRSSSISQPLHLPHLDPEGIPLHFHVPSTMQLSHSGPDSRSTSISQPLQHLNLDQGEMPLHSVFEYRQVSPPLQPNVPSFTGTSDGAPPQTSAASVFPMVHNDMSPFGTTSGSMSPQASTANFPPFTRTSSGIAPHTPAVNPYSSFGMGSSDIQPFTTSSHGLSPQLVCSGSMPSQSTPATGYFRQESGFDDEMRSGQEPSHNSDADSIVMGDWISVRGYDSNSRIIDPSVVMNMNMNMDLGMNSMGESVDRMFPIHEMSPGSHSTNPSEISGGITGLHSGSYPGWTSNQGSDNSSPAISTAGLPVPDILSTLAFNDTEKMRNMIRDIRNFADSLEKVYKQQY